MTTQTTNKLIGRKVLGNWGNGAGWEYGVITNVEADSFGTDVVINWEENGQKRIDINELTTVNEYTNTDAVGIYLLAVEDAEETTTEAPKQTTKETDSLVGRKVYADRGIDGGKSGTITGTEPNSCVIVTWQDGYKETVHMDEFTTINSWNDIREAGLYIFEEVSKRNAESNENHSEEIMTKEETSELTNEIIKNNISDEIMIEINDITDSKYNISQSIIDREHEANWIFRKQKKDYNKEIQEYFTECNNKVLEVISTTNNEYIIFKLKESLQRFKKNYHGKYVKYLTAKGNTPSLAVTGIAGRNMNKYNKDMDRQNSIMMELASMPEEFNNLIDKYKNKIWKDKQTKIQNKVKSTNINLKFTTKTKEFEFMRINQKKRVYISGEYFICKTWGTFRIFKLKTNKEIHSMKTKEKLEDAKRFVAYLIQQDQQKAF